MTTVLATDGETGKLDSPTATAMTSSDGLRELSDQASVEGEVAQSLLSLISM